MKRMHTAIIPLGTMEGYMTQHDVNMLVHYNTGLHEVIAEAVRIILESATRIDDERLMMRIRKDEVDKMWDARPNTPMHACFEDLLNHYYRIVWIVYNKLYYYLYEISTYLTSGPGFDYFVFVTRHHYHPDGAIEIELNSDYLPF